MKKLFVMAMMIAASVGLTNAQTTQKQIVEEGGTGPFKSEVVGDASCPGFTVYRPQNLKEVVAKQGCLPVIVYANGACFNNNVEMRLLLSEVASYGYVAAAIGPYDEADVMAQWRGVLFYQPIQHLQQHLGIGLEMRCFRLLILRFLSFLCSLFALLGLLFLSCLFLLWRQR